MKKLTAGRQLVIPWYRRKSVWAAGAVLVLVVAVVIAHRSGLNLPGLAKHTAEEDFEQHDYEATVTVGSKGFMPQVLKVKPYTRVYFENQDTADHSVDVTAGEPDSRFVNSDVIPPNGGYGFTFTKNGTYNFHDGDNALANGQVVVGN